MEIIRGRHNLQAEHHGCVVSIGNFDGVHLGHMSLLQALRERAQHWQMPSCVICFEPHPQEYFAPTKPPRLSRLSEKYRLLAAQGIDRLLVLRFNAKLAAESPESFVQQLLVQQLGARALVIGDDFRFGHQRRGDVHLLQTMAASQGFELIAMPSMIREQQRVSSTLIRQSLAQGDLTTAASLLGRPYRYQGKVVQGQQLARQWGFPTANLAMGNWQAPLRGVFAIRSHHQGQCLHGVANLGTRPTLAGTRLVLEVHYLDFAADLYGQSLHVEFLHKLRDEIRFPSLDALRQQIQTDIDTARAFFAA